MIGAGLHLGLSRRLKLGVKLLAHRRNGKTWQSPDELTTMHCLPEGA